MSGGAFTWSNNQNSPTLEKLDKILVTREWEMLFPTVHVYKEATGMSDHNPLFLATQVVKSEGGETLGLNLPS
jgi:endonuclease/exonuclease/phosphatase family metal-dependent hydrolase